MYDMTAKHVPCPFEQGLCWHSSGHTAFSAIQMNIICSTNRQYATGNTTGRAGGVDSTDVGVQAQLETVAHLCEH